MLMSLFEKYQKTKYLTLLTDFLIDWRDWIVLIWFAKVHDICRFLYVLYIYSFIGLTWTIKPNSL